MTKVKIADLVLRDAHQSLLATRMLTSDMLPIAPKLDKVGYWALESWGGATFDTCIRYLNEDPWDRIRQLKAAIPNTPMMMLLRGQNALGYRHYADDVILKFVERAAFHGIDIFRIFDALNDPRNIECAVRAVKKAKKHAQAAISYATTPFHTIDVFVNIAKEYKNLGVDSICIKDMAGLLRPYDAYELTTKLKQKVGLPVHIHSHATPGMSVATLVKAVEAGADILDTAISSLAMGTSHSPTETMVAIFQGTPYDTGLDIKLLAEISEYFREIKKKYKSFESSFTGADPRILIAQIPGGMLSNMESQLKEFKASDKLDAVLAEIPLVQKDFGYIPLVTPTSQIVGVQAVFNILYGRYNQISKEAKDLLVGNYGKTPAPPNQDLVQKVLKEMNMTKAIIERPADRIPNEINKIENDLKQLLGLESVSIEDVLTYAMFPQIAPKFFKTRSNGPVKMEAPKENINTIPAKIMEIPQPVAAPAKIVEIPQSAPARNKRSSAKENTDDWVYPI
ncbi:MAG: pyruvate carboxylase subunit B [Candidatus Brocadiae bacterium]|nr:pyruvate carboxylase subunit B [Candidatus Brocadiia bacterium]